MTVIVGNASTNHKRSMQALERESRVTDTISWRKERGGSPVAMIANCIIFTPITVLSELHQLPSQG